MKNKFTLWAGLCLSLSVSAQSLNDDFESYNIGDYLGATSPNWTTWSGTTGGAEDVQISNINAHNGTNSIYFASTAANGGPQDVVLPFGGVYNSGQFDFEAWFFVESGKGAYFNIQGASTIGQVYSMNCSMNENGEMVIDNNDGTYISTTYPTGTWFNLKLSFNLNINDWEILIDNVSQGVFQNTQNLVASMDLYPVNGVNNGGNNQAGFYVDEVSYTHTPYTLPNKNGAVIAITNTEGLASQDFNPTVQVRNLGVQNITSFDVTIDYSGNQYVENVTGVSIASYATYDVDFSQAIQLIAGANNIVATISNVNGTGVDDDINDDEKTLVLDPIVPAIGKMVLSEEGTGTWCGWCPRGAVMLDKMEALYHDYFVGIAVHNNDPMVVELYDDGLNFSSFPRARTDRGLGMNPTQIESEFYQRITEVPSAFITNGAYYNAGNGKLYVSVTADFQTDIAGDYRLACALTEDSVTGTGSGYNQSNYYSGGGSGVMGGYELLPNPVPAAQMVYDHVARAILPNVNGQVNSFPATVTTGETHTVAFVFDIDSTWDMSKMHIVGFMIADDGSVDNAGRATLEEAYANGYLSVENVETVSANVEPVYPNPSSDDIAFVDVSVASASQVSLTILDLQGKQVQTKDYGLIEGHFKLPIQIALLPAGLYTIQLQIGSEFHTQKLVVN